MPDDTLPTLGKSFLHLCVDMQRLFAEETDWHTPWMARIAPAVARLVERDPARTVFTRFVPARRPGEGEGTWRAYYERWASMTVEALGPERVELMPDLARFVPPAGLLDKRVYSPWMEPDLDRLLAGTGVDTLIVTGGETDVCVLATVLGAVDRGYRVILATDALCGSSDETHDDTLDVYRRRFSLQVETATVDEILAAWPED